MVRIHHAAIALLFAVAVALPAGVPPNQELSLEQDFTGVCSGNKEEDSATCRTRRRMARRSVEEEQTDDGEDEVRLILWLPLLFSVLSRS
jgi:hypothetical protein